MRIIHTIISFGYHSVVKWLGQESLSKIPRFRGANSDSKFSDKAIQISKLHLLVSLYVLLK